VTAQGRPFGRELRGAPDLPVPTPTFANDGIGNGPLGSEDRANFHP